MALPQFLAGGEFHMPGAWKADTDHHAIQQDQPTMDVAAHY